MFVVLGGCDHFWAEGVRCRVVLAGLDVLVETKGQAQRLLLDRNGRERTFMVALKFVGEIFGVDKWLALTRLGSSGLIVR
jgi:hypothetical protein